MTAWCRSLCSTWCAWMPSASTPGGRRAPPHALPQEDINHLLVRLAREGKRVVRLKGGDPFIFGRGGEEIATLMDEGIPFQVVPGITAAAGCASYAGIPLTHRDYSQSVVFVTGHLQDGSMNLNWPALAQPRQTVVFYMGLHGVDILCRELVAHGLPTATPAALIQQGTTPQQRVLTGDLATLPEIVRRSDVKAPTLIIIGEVVRLRDRLNWFEPRRNFLSERQPWRIFLPRPCSTAITAALTRESTPSLRRIALTCSLTVPSVMFSAFAITLLLEALGDML